MWQIWRDILAAWGAIGFSSTPVPPAQGSSARERNPHDFRLQKAAEIVAELDGEFLQSQEFF